MFGNHNKKRKIKRLQREKQRAKIKKGKAIAAEKKRLRKLQEEQSLTIVNDDKSTAVNKITAPVKKIIGSIQELAIDLRNPALYC